MTGLMQPGCIRFSVCASHISLPREFQGKPLLLLEVLLENVNKNIFHIVVLKCAESHWNKATWNGIGVELERNTCRYMTKHRLIWRMLKASAGKGKIYRHSRITWELPFSLPKSWPAHLVSMNVKRDSKNNSSGLICFYILKYCVYVP